MEPFVGEIIMFSGSYPPRGFALCDGQLLPISQHQALFTLLGTSYGGDGQTSFGLPDLRGRLPVHHGQGTGLSERTLGAHGGSETVVLDVHQMPPHSHSIRASTTIADAADPGAHVLATPSTEIYTDDTADTALDSSAVERSGAGEPHPNLMPYLAVHFCIALVGIFPARRTVAG